MNDNENRSGLVDGWWAASSEAEHEQTVTLRRRENGSEPLLDRFTVAPETMPTFEDFEFSVKERFGGGLYVVVISGKSGQFGKRIPFAIAGLPKREAGQDDKNAGGGLEGLAAILMKNQEASEARMMAVLEKMSEKPEAPDAFELFDKVAAHLGKVGAAPAPQKTLVEQMRELREGAEMMGLTGKPEGDEDGGWAKDLIATFGPALMGGFVATPAPAEGDDEGEAPPADAQAAMVNKLRLLLVSMVQLAEFEVEPAKAVTGIEKKAGQYWPMLQQVIQREDALTMAAQMVPAVGQHQKWFEAFRAIVIGAKPEGGTGGSTGGIKAGDKAGGKKSAASPKPRPAVKRGSRNTADA